VGSLVQARSLALVVVEGYHEFVREPESDPLRLENFFPWPKPLWSVMANDTLKPTPEYTLYQDQALELDDLTQRIDVLTSALRRRGVYDAQFKEMLTMLTGKDDNQFVPSTTWAALMQKGGLEKVAMEMPIDPWWQPSCSSRTGARRSSRSSTK
jgi:hypothetical protein